MSWRELLDEIVKDIGLTGEEAKQLKKSINGVIAYANGSIRGELRSSEAVYSACLQRFDSKPEMLAFAEHPLFTDFLLKKILI